MLVKTTMLTVCLIGTAIGSILYALVQSAKEMEKLSLIGMLCLMVVALVIVLKVVWTRAENYQSKHEKMYEAMLKEKDEMIAYLKGKSGLK